MLNDETRKAISLNPNFADKQLLGDLAELFAGKEEALCFLKLYGDYGELVDDQVDESKDINRTQEIDRLKMELSVNPYFLKNYTALWIVERLVHNTFFDSVKWEKSNSEWKRRDAKALSHCGYMMLFAVILIEFGMEELNKFSLRFREHAHLKHLNDPI